MLIGIRGGSMKLLNGEGLLALALAREKRIS